MARFLVVDDDGSALSSLERLLRLDGHDVSAFATGAEAVDALARERFDAVLTDLEMPHTDGHAVVEAARASHPEACVVVVSANATPAHHELLADAGACFLAEKPLEYDDVVAAIARCHAHRAHAGKRCHERAPHARVTPLRRK